MEQTHIAITRTVLVEKLPSKIIIQFDGGIQGYWYDNMKGKVFKFKNTYSYETIHGTVSVFSISDIEIHGGKSVISKHAILKW